MTYTTGLSLIEIITGNEASPKAIVMAGAAGSGKSTLLEKLKEMGLTLPEIVNQDDYVEDLTKAIKGVERYYPETTKKQQEEKAQLIKDLKEGEKKLSVGFGGKIATLKRNGLVREKSDFVFDTTAGGTKFEPIVDGLKEKGYKIFMVYNYAHPFVSYVSNAIRSRKIPTDSVLDTWNSVFNKAESFKKMFGENFVMHVRDDSDHKKQIEEFNKAAASGAEGLKKFIDEFDEKLQKEKGVEKGSSFFDEVEMEPEEEAAFLKAVQNIDYNKDDRSEVKKLKEAFLKTFRDTGEGPGEEVFKKEINKYRKSKQNRDSKFRQVLGDIAAVLRDDERLKVIQGTDVEVIKQQIQNFLR